MVSEPRSIQRVTHHIIHTPSPKVLGVRGCIGKNISLTLARDNVKIKYISGGQFLTYELTFGVELGPNSHSKMVSKSILDPFKRSPTMLSTH